VVVGASTRREQEIYRLVRVEFAWLLHLRSLVAMQNDNGNVEEDGHRVRFETQLEMLRSNIIITFDIWHAWGFGQEEERWSLFQASELLSALKDNTSVVNLLIDHLQDCPLTAIPLLWQYI
jgi:hypothetical protein